MKHWRIEPLGLARRPGLGLRGGLRPLPRRLQDPDRRRRLHPRLPHRRADRPLHGRDRHLVLLHRPRRGDGRARAEAGLPADRGGRVPPLQALLRPHEAVSRAREPLLRPPPARRRRADRGERGRRARLRLPLRERGPRAALQPRPVHRPLRGPRHGLLPLPPRRARHGHDLQGGGAGAARPALGRRRAGRLAAHAVAARALRPGAGARRGDAPRGRARGPGGMTRRRGGPPGGAPRPGRRALLASPAAGWAGQAAAQPAAGGPGGLRDVAARHGVAFGLAVQARPLAADAPYAAATAREAAVLVSEGAGKWWTLRPAEGRFEFAPLDAIASFAARHGQRVRGHTLVWHAAMRPWAEAAIAEGPARARALLEEHLDRVLGHTAPAIRDWDVANEAVVGPRNSA